MDACARPLRRTFLLHDVALRARSSRQSINERVGVYRGAIRSAGSRYRNFKAASCSPSMCRLLSPLCGAHALLYSLHEQAGKTVSDKPPSPRVNGSGTRVPGHEPTSPVEYNNIHVVHSSYPRGDTKVHVRNLMWLVT